MAQPPVQPTDNSNKSLLIDLNNVETVSSNPLVDTNRYKNGNNSSEKQKLPTNVDQKSTIEHGTLMMTSTRNNQIFDSSAAKLETNVKKSGQSAALSKPNSSSLSNINNYNAPNQSAPPDSNNDYQNLQFSSPGSRMDKDSNIIITVHPNNLDIFNATQQTSLLSHNLNSSTNNKKIITTKTKEEEKFKSFATKFEEIKTILPTSEEQAEKICSRLPVKDYEWTFVSHERFTSLISQFREDHTKSWNKYNEPLPEKQQIDHTGTIKPVGDFGHISEKTRKMYGWKVISPGHTPITNCIDPEILCGGRTLFTITGKFSRKQSVSMMEEFKTYLNAFHKNEQVFDQSLPFQTDEQKAKEKSANIVLGKYGCSVGLYISNVPIMEDPNERKRKSETVNNTVLDIQKYTEAEQYDPNQFHLVIQNYYMTPALKTFLENVKTKNLSVTLEELAERSEYKESFQKSIDMRIQCANMIFTQCISKKFINCSIHKVCDNLFNVLDQYTDTRILNEPNTDPKNRLTRKILVWSDHCISRNSVQNGYLWGLGYPKGWLFFRGSPNSKNSKPVFSTLSDEVNKRPIPLGETKIVSYLSGVSQNFQSPTVKWGSNTPNGYSDPSIYSEKFFSVKHKQNIFEKWGMHYETAIKLDLVCVYISTPPITKHSEQSSLLQSQIKPQLTLRHWLQYTYTIPSVLSQHTIADTKQSLTLNEESQNQPEKKQIVINTKYVNIPMQHPFYTDLLTRLFILIHQPMFQPSNTEGWNSKNTPIPKIKDLEIQEHASGFNIIMNRTTLFRALSRMNTQICNAILDCEKIETLENVKKIFELK